MKVGQPLAQGKSGAFEPETSPRHEMLLIPGGTFRMGSDRHYPEEAPVHRVSVDAFWIDHPPSQRPSSFSIDQIVEKMRRSFESTGK